MNTDFADLADLAARLLTTHPDAPPVSSVWLDESHPHGWTVAMQIHHHQDPAATVAALADWAGLLGTCVRLTDCDTYVDVSAVTRVEGRQVRIWGHLAPRLGLALLAELGVTAPRGPVEAVPELIVAALDRGVFPPLVAA